MDSKPPIFLTARWENLVMLNYEVPERLLKPYLPFGTELDLFNGKVLVSLVGFLFKDTKVFGVKWPMHTHFEEVNLRFYVKRFDGIDWKRGVVFISELVPRRIIALLANKLYREPYRAMKMAHNMKMEGDSLHIAYSWQTKNVLNKMEVVANASPKEIKKNSEEEFIFEHYWGYNKYDEKTTIEYGVEHDMWQVYPVNEWRLSCDVALLYGNQFVEVLSGTPTSVLLAKGSEVVIRKPRFIRKVAPR